MIEVRRNSIPAAYEYLWKHVWHYGEKSVDRRGDIVRTLRYVWIEIKTDDITYPTKCPVAEPIAEKFALGLVDDKEAALIGDEFDYGYGERLRKYNALQYVINMLKVNVNDRRACIPITQTQDFYYAYKDNKEIPCATQIEFEYCNGSLDIIVHMRSNDVLNAFPSDAYGFRRLQEYVCQQLNVPIGHYYQWIKNAHIVEHLSESWIMRNL